VSRSTDRLEVHPLRDKSIGEPAATYPVKALLGVIAADVSSIKT
jgi:hypothetical protein